jgi:HD domain
VFARRDIVTVGEIMAETIAGIAVPDSRMAREATDFICDVETPLLFHHSRRTYLFGMLHGQLRDQSVDPELLYVAAMFHDLGLVEGHQNLSQRFEVDGADAARDFLRAHDIGTDEIRRVWSAIALHTTHGVPVFMEPEIALLAAGVETDVDGAGLDVLDPADVREVVSAHPRLQFKKNSLPTFAEGFKNRPDTTFGAITADVLAHYSPGFQRKDFVEVVRNNAWTE